MKPAATIHYNTCARPAASILDDFPTQRGCNLVCWGRVIPDDVSQSLAAWAPTKPDCLERLIRSPNAETVRAPSGLPKNVGSWLESDISSLTRILFEVADPHALVVKLSVINSDQCRKFHVDYVRYRLLATYLGPGTEWIPNEYVDREALSDPPEEPSAANAVIVKDASRVRRAAAGDVLLMKGARHPHGVALAHRSPPIEHTKKPRVLLAISTRDY